MKKKNWILTGTIGSAALLASAGLFFQFLQLDFKPFLAYIPDTIGETVGYFSSLFQVEDGKIGFTGAQVISRLMRISDLPSQGSLEARILAGFGAMVLIPLFLSLIVFGLSFIQCRPVRMYGMMISLIGILFLVFATLFHFPDTLYREIPEKVQEAAQTAQQAGPLIDKIKNTFGLSDQLTDYFAGNAEKIEEVFEDLTPGDMQRIVFHSLGPGWRMSLAALVMQFVCFGFSLLTFRPAKQYRKAEKAVRQEEKKDFRKIPCDGPAVIVERGSMKGTRIRLGIGTRLSVGRDPGQCTLVLEDVGMDPLHCVISFDPSENLYHVRDYSRKGIFCQGKRLETKAVNYLPGDSRISLGSERNVLYLELAKPPMVTFVTGYQEDGSGLV